jgi:hypothetical protein
LALLLLAPEVAPPFSGCSNPISSAQAEVAAMEISRREFVKLMTSSGIALSVSRAALAQNPTFAARETLPGRQTWNPAATGAGRIDGLAKVTGAKLYASDFRAADHRRGVSDVNSTGTLIACLRCAACPAAYCRRQ